MSSQSNLLASIAKTEMLIQAEKIRLTEHKLYFTNLKNNHKVMLISLLLPSFIMGWQMGKQLGLQKKITRFTNYALFTLWAKARKVYLPAWF